MVWGERSVSRDEVRLGDGSLEYRYIIGFGGESDAGPTLVATTSDTDPGDYDTNKASLDVMVRTFDLTGDRSARSVWRSLAAHLLWEPLALQRCGTSVAI
jgi:hypothetical protein